MDVDEAGADHEAGGVDSLTGIESGWIAANDDKAVVSDSNGARHPRVAGPIDDQPIVE